MRVLFRPPAEESHYYREASGELTFALLDHLAREESAVVVLSPEVPAAGRISRALSLDEPPVVLQEAVPFVPLLKSADLIVSSGGTMVREAAFLGIPSYSIYRGELGGVDRHLANAGRLRLLSSPADFEALELSKRGPIDVLAGNPSLLAELADAVLTRAGGRSRLS